MQEIEEKFMIVSAESTHLIMKIEKLFSKQKIDCRIIPLPTEISAECGLAIRFKIEDKNRVLKLLGEFRNEMNIYYVEKKGLKKKLKKFYYEGEYSEDSKKNISWNNCFNNCIFFKYSKNII